MDKTLAGLIGAVGALAAPAALANAMEAHSYADLFRPIPNAAALLQAADAAPQDETARVQTVQFHDHHHHHHHRYVRRYHHHHHHRHRPLIRIIP